MGAVEAQMDGVFICDVDEGFPSVVWVFDGTGPRQQLELYSDGPRHSPTGFAHGYSGSGPAELAYSLIRRVYRGRRPAPRLYQAFKRQRIAALDQQKGWRITFEEIRDFVRQAEAQEAADLLWDDEDE